MRVNQSVGLEYFHMACSRNPQPYSIGKNGKYQCPCCSCFTLEEMNSYDICPVCFWEDDGAIKDDDPSGPNHMTLGEGREMYRKFGYVSEHIKEHVRSPLPDEIEEASGE